METPRRDTGQRAYEGSMSGIYRKQKEGGQCDQSQLGEGAEKQKEQRKRSMKACGSCEDVFDLLFQAAKKPMEVAFYI